MQKIVVKFGLIAGAIMSAAMLVAMRFEDEIGFDRGALVGYTSMVAAFLMIYFGVRACRERSGGVITFGKALGVALAIMVVASACYVATWEIYYFKLSPGFVDKYAGYVIEQKRAAGATEEELAATRQEMADFKVKYDNPLYNSALTFLEPLPVGLVISLVTAAALRRGRRPGDAAGGTA